MEKDKIKKLFELSGLKRTIGSVWDNALKFAKEKHGDASQIQNVFDIGVWEEDMAEVFKDFLNSEVLENMLDLFSSLQVSELFNNKWFRFQERIIKRQGKISNEEIKKELAAFFTKDECSILDKVFLDDPDMQNSMDSWRCFQIEVLNVSKEYIINKLSLQLPKQPLSN